MRIFLTTISAGSLSLALSALSMAQGGAPPAIPAPPPAQAPTPAPAPPPAPAAPAAPRGLAYDPQQFPAFRGELERLTLTARGDIDGFILKDGTEVKTAPDLSTQMAFVFKPGDKVTVHGLKAAALPLVSAVSITDEATHRTVTDSGISAQMYPPPPPPAPPLRGGPPQSPGVAGETSGRVRMALHGPQGEVNGVLLESGTILRFPPDPDAQVAALIQPHQPLVAEGTALTTALGTVVDVQQIGSSRDHLVSIGPPPHPMHDRGPRDLRRRPSPASDGAPPPPALSSPPPAPPAS